MVKILRLFIALGLPVFLVAGDYAQGAVANPAVKVEGRQLLVDFDHDGVYEPFLVKAVGYSPMPVGRHVSDWGWPVGDPRLANIYDDPAILERDFTLLQNMHANAIRIWKGNNTTQPDGRFPNKITTRTLDIAQKQVFMVKVIYLPSGHPLSMQ